MKIAFLPLVLFAATALAQSSHPRLQVKVLAQSPAETTTDLQIFCLFRSTPQNTLHGSLTETNQKLHGLLDRIRQPSLFSGDLGETLLLVPPPGTLNARRILIIGLGDSSTFTPDRMELVGRIAFREANRLGVSHPFFAPTILDGGVTGFATGDVALHVVRGFLQARATEDLLNENHASTGVAVQDFTFLAGVKNVPSTQQGIDQALGTAAH